MAQFHEAVLAEMVLTLGYFYGLPKGHKCIDFL